MCLSNTQQLLLEAESLLKNIEEMLVWFTKTTPSRRRWHAVDRQADIKGDEDTLVIEGFRFVDAASQEGLQKLISQAGVK
ncbi:hypothetical protein ATANTOWER_008003 [Ataeniobius toweri]|uniref:Uncharacterized protein n=1 Tax=Ataeniobius toweri TaxID=208326 RepID=A0ABU7A511_9TELE|nr:hypothetical protein [Ataeniobius toweri]